MRYKFEDKDIKLIKKNLFIIIDSREQENSHITKEFDKKKIPYIVTTLKKGDYSIGIKSTDETKKIGIHRDIWFDKDVVIERKAHIDEMAGNFKKEDRDRIASEFAHLRASGTKVHFWVEDKDFNQNIRAGNYRSKYLPKSLYRSIKTFVCRYNLNFQAVEKSLMWSEIWNTLEIEALEILKDKGYIELDLNLEVEESKHEQIREEKTS